MSGEIEEMLSAYLDGNLSDADREALEVRIASDPSVSERLERLRSNDTMLRTAMADGISDTADEATLSRFGLGDEPAPPERAAANDNRKWVWPAAAAIAAGAAVFLATRPAVQTEPWQTPAFSQALDVTPSLQEASLPHGNALKPSLSFVAGDGRYCREFNLSAASPAASRDGVACRDKGGKWQAIALIRPSGSLSSAGKIDVAGGSGSNDLDAVYGRLNASDPLPAAQERSLIASHWATPATGPE